MSKRYTQVPYTYLSPIFQEWERTYTSGDLLNVFFMPKGDILFRAMQFVDWMQEQRGESVRLVNFETELIVNSENLRLLLEENTDSKLVLVVRRELMRPDGKLMAAVLEEWYAKYSRGIVLLHEGFPTELDKHVQSPILSQKRMIHRIYPANVMRVYIDEMRKFFSIEPEDEWVTEVITYCSGIPWLVNDCLRRYGEDNIFEDAGFLWKVAEIAKNIPDGEGVEPELRQMGLKNEEGEWLPALQRYFSQTQKQSLAVAEDQVLYSGRDYTLLFSASERRLLHKLMSQTGIISREELGETLWKNERSIEYSDWAFDAMMSRLRKKIAKLGLPIVIKTRRGRGYELN